MPPTNVVRKSLRIDQAKLDRAKEILGTETDTETVNAALDVLAFRKEVFDGVREIAGTNGFRDIQAEDDEP